MSVSVIVVAAGRGVRAGGETPKQLLDLGGQTMLQRSVAACDAHPDVDELVVVLPAEWVGEGQELVGATRARCHVVAGGERRQDSVRAGFSAVKSSARIVLVHDAARPFVSRAVIDRVLAAAAETGAAVPALQASDTVKRAGMDGRRRVSETVPRSEVWLAQTPQGFRRDVLAAAIAASAGQIEATDEAQLVELMGGEVQLVDGDAGNVKVTTADDVARARAAWAGQSRVGTGYDLHQLTVGRPLVLAGVMVPSSLGPIAHSDGDVVCHAITDAILGAAGAGDIGQQFPDTDARWKDAPGLDLLARAVATVREHGWRVVNVDVSVLLERPKLLPHVPAIRAKLAQTLGVPMDAVSVKGKSNEKVDAVGRGEAIASHAVVLLSGHRA
ncbi:MAG TPA: 2-C-methyl-D-erythritol 4-phosphate cytidylyltransferase [Vicinamibacterales bacterium]|nr:2-C-methyl-D-erythritol 4-phosphate cytidylyltransferase [Vicinamibacterales bacterium]